MQSMKVIKRRISSVKSTRKIMRAMDLVATSKLQKAKARMNAALPLFHETKRIMEDFKYLESAQENVYVKPREVKNIAYVVITSDRGLCGGYNTNVSNKALLHIKQDTESGANVSEKIVAVGVRGWEFFKRRNKDIVRKYAGISETAFYEDAEMLGRYLTDLYIAGEVDEIYVAYTQFESMMSHIPCVEKIFPIGDADNTQFREIETEFVPDADTFLSHAAPAYLNAFLYGAMAQSAACEQAARMVSMDAATNNAEEIIDDLSRMFNRIRQSAITQEINEIVSGANVHK